MDKLPSLLDADIHKSCTGFSLFGEIFLMRDEVFLRRDEAFLLFSVPCVGRWP